MYLQHFHLKQFPFGLTPNTEFFCNLRGYQEALNVLLFGISTGEGFIKVIGEVGAGKTILCRKFLAALDDNYMTAYIPNPSLNPVELRKALARELAVNVPLDIDQFELLNLLNGTLLELYKRGKKVVLVIDEAQTLSDESLEALRLLTNLETESDKLMQIILFAQPELNVRLNQHRFRQLNQRITFSYYLRPLAKEDLYAYISHRLSVAGYTRGALLTDHALSLLYRASGGIPRIINILCHKALLVSYGLGDHAVGRRAMMRAVNDSREIVQSGAGNLSSLGVRVLVAASAVMGVGILGACFYYYYLGALFG